MGIHSFTPFISRARSVSAIERAFLPGETCYRCDNCDAPRDNGHREFCGTCRDFTGAFLSRGYDLSDGDYLFSELGA